MPHTIFNCHLKRDSDSKLRSERVQRGAPDRKCSEKPRFPPKSKGLPLIILGERVQSLSTCQSPPWWPVIQVGRPHQTPRYPPWSACRPRGEAGGARGPWGGDRPAERMPGMAWRRVWGPPGNPLRRQGPPGWGRGTTEHIAYCGAQTSVWKPYLAALA